MCIQKLMAVLVRRVSRPRVSIAKPNQLQPELSLDAVKVIRNDLSDADLEVVAVKKSNSAPQQELISLVTTKREAMSAVGRATTRLMAVLHL